MAADVREMKRQFKELETRRDELVEQLKQLRRRHERKEITDQEYEDKQYVIEREIVEVMDRLVQMRYLLNIGDGASG
ncbi:MAG: hypothetical protein QW057_04870 [Candidatus Bathyarchaeia archaeon]